MLRQDFQHIVALHAALSLLGRIVLVYTEEV